MEFHFNVSNGSITLIENVIVMNEPCKREDKFAFGLNVEAILQKIFM